MLGVRHDARIGGVDAVDVGVDLADVGVQRGREGDGGGVGATAAERGDVLGVLGDALEAGDEDDLAVVDGGLDTPGCDVDDLRRAVTVGGDDAGLRAREGLRLSAE